MRNYTGRTTGEFYKGKEIELSEPGKKQQPKTYLYKQVENGVNVRLAKPIETATVRYHKHVFKTGKGNGNLALEGTKNPPMDQIV